MSKKIVILHQGIEGSDDPMIVNAVRLRNNLVLAITGLGYVPEPVYLDEKFQWVSRIIDFEPDLVFNVADLGFFNNILYEPNIAAVLDGIGVPYTGSDYYSLAFSGDKFASKIYLELLGIPVPKCWMAEQINGSLEFPVILKQRRVHNSEGISIDSVVHTPDELGDRLNKGGQDVFIAEEYIEGKEICAGFIGNKNRIMLPIVEFKFGESFNGREKIRDFDTKWDEKSEQYLDVQAEFTELPEVVVATVNDYVNEIARIFDVRDYGRFDFRLRSNKGGVVVPYIIDINGNPDINNDASLYKMAKQLGLDYKSFIKEIIHSAFDRYGLRN